MRIGWKKVVVMKRTDHDVASDREAVLKLEILGDVIKPFDGSVYLDSLDRHATKYRTNRVKVLSAYELDGSPLVLNKGEYFASLRDYNFRYTVGRVRLPDGFNRNRYADCGRGIHFFAHRSAAAAYEL